MRHLVTGAENALDRLKTETAQEIGVTLKGYNPDLTCRDAGRVGGGIVKKMIEDYERTHAGE
jgi:hypothetical protein